jgi:hypothetical protein
MDQIFSRPEIQSAVLPFVLGLVLYLALRKLTVNAWIWAVFTAFLISVGLINGLTLTPLTGTRKIILLILASFVIAGSAPQLIASIKLRRAILATFSVIAFLFVFWKIAARMELADMGLFIGASLALVLWLLWAFERIGNNDTQLHAAGFSLLLGTGISTSLAASALLGQLAISLAAASGAVLLGWVIKGSAGNNTGSYPSLPYALSAALLGLAAVIFARLPWYMLIPLASIPLITGFVPKISETRFTHAFISSLAGLIIAVAVSLWVWQMDSSSSGY